MTWTFLRLFIGYTLQIFPWAFLCFYPFCGSLRAKDRFYVILPAFTGVLAVIFSSVCCILKRILPATNALYFSCNLVFFILLVCCVVFYLYMVRESFTKKLFIFFFICTAALCSTSVGNAVLQLLIHMSHSAVDFLPYWGYNILINFLFTLVTWPFLFYILRYRYMTLSPFISEKIDRFLAIVSPVLFIIFASGMTFADLALYPPDLLSVPLYIILLSAVIFIYRMLFQLLQIDQDELLSKNKILQLEQQLKLNESQYRRISENIENSRKMRHDLRHHMLVLQGYMNEDAIDKAKTYIRHYIQVLDQETPHSYSENAIINYIISHYHTAARQQDISFCCIPKDIPRELPIRAADLSVILGNLLENALTAASRVEEGGRYINMHIMYTAQILVVTVDNPFAGEIKKTGGTYVSQKPDHMGLGIASITDIVQSYDGGIEFTHEDQVFHASVMLNLADNGMPDPAHPRHHGQRGKLAGDPLP